MKPEYTEQQLTEITTLTTELLIAPFPAPGSRLRNAFKELNTATNGSSLQKTTVNDGGGLQRPWIPATCRDPGVRAELFAWLDEIVMWLNEQYTWDTTALIPPCWPMHPHIVNELVVVADLRRLAEEATVSEKVETWHRDVLPGFFDRMRERLGHACDDGEHTPWPGKPRHRTYIGAESRDLRADRVTRDHQAQRRMRAIEREAIANADGGRSVESAKQNPQREDRDG